MTSASSSQFVWRVDSRGHCRFAKPFPSHATEWDLGPLVDVLRDFAFGLRREELLGDRREPKMQTWVCNPVPSLAQIGESCGLRRLTAEHWRRTAPNPVLHPQFGPGITVAFDEVHCILWDSLTPGCNWMLVHRTNVWGPVTSTPTHPEEWCGKDGERSSRERPLSAESQKAVAECLKLLSL